MVHHPAEALWSYGDGHGQQQVPKLCQMVNLQSIQRYYYNMAVGIIYGTWDFSPFFRNEEASYKGGETISWNLDIS